MCIRNPPIRRFGPSRFDRPAFEVRPPRPLMVRRLVETFDGEAADANQTGSDGEFLTIGPDLAS